MHSRHDCVRIWADNLPNAAAVECGVYYVVNGTVFMCDRQFNASKARHFGHSKFNYWNRVGPQIAAHVIELGPTAKVYIDKAQVLADFRKMLEERPLGPRHWGVFDVNVGEVVLAPRTLPQYQSPLVRFSRFGGAHIEARLSYDCDTDEMDYVEDIAIYWPHVTAEIRLYDRVIWDETNGWDDEMIARLWRWDV